MSEVSRGLNAENPSQNRLKTNSGGQDSKKSTQSDRRIPGQPKFRRILPQIT